jgi:hypothetical protein
MFWKKKSVAIAPSGGASPQTESPVDEQVVSTALRIDKLSGPQEIPELVGRNLVVTKKCDPDWVWRLKVVVKKNEKGKKTFDVRIYDEMQREKRRVKIKDWNTLDEYPDLILYEGWFDKDSMHVELEESKRKDEPVSQKDGELRILTENEIWQKIADLKEPGSTVFFYLAGSPSTGGPLGRGAAMVELNPDYPGPKQKRYILYTANVEDLQPVGKGRKFLDSDHSRDVAKWIKERHYKPASY